MPFAVGQIIVVFRKDCGGNRIPVEYRWPVAGGEYTYLARIVSMPAGKRYFRVAPMSWARDEPARPFTRKAYVSKVQTLEGRL